MLKLTKSIKRALEYSGIQKGSISVKFDDNYTATVRNLKDFISYINAELKSGRLKNEIKIISFNKREQPGDLTKTFISGVKEVVERTNFLINKKRGFEVKTFKNVRFEAPKKLGGGIFEVNLKVREDNKFLTLLDDFGGEWSFKYQGKKATGKGEYLNIYGERYYFVDYIDFNTKQK